LARERREGFALLGHCHPRTVQLRAGREEERGHLFALGHGRFGHLPAFACLELCDALAERVDRLLVPGVPRISPGGRSLLMHNFPIFVHVLTCLLDWLHPRATNVRRLTELSVIARDVASTDASSEEAEELAAVCIHESGCVLGARGKDGSIGPWQVRPPAKSFGAGEALKRLRWSEGVCGKGDLSLYAGFGYCVGHSASPEGDARRAVLASLLDPTLPRK
jgi:hypothetical protein